MHEFRCSVIWIRYRSYTGQFPQAFGPTPAKPSGDHIPLGGFVFNNRRRNAQSFDEGYLSNRDHLGDARMAVAFWMDCEAAVFLACPNVAEGIEPESGSNA